ncbi:hypothetical protein N7527_008440 [Penicillium freii]|nr:hypothetical protein N7527_008440 [Penicillium freii]
MTAEIAHFNSQIEEGVLEEINSYLKEVKGQELLALPSPLPEAKQRVAIHTVLAPIIETHP